MKAEVDDSHSRALSTCTLPPRILPSLPSRWNLDQIPVPLCILASKVLCCWPKVIEQRWLGEGDIAAFRLSLLQKESQLSADGPFEIPVRELQFDLVKAGAIFQLPESQVLG